MTVTDTNGRPYLKLSEARDKQIIELDDGFTCQLPGQVVLCKDKLGIYFECDDGHHYIDGQADDGEHCIGMYKVQP